MIWAQIVFPAAIRQNPEQVSGFYINSEFVIPLVFAVILVWHNRALGSFCQRTCFVVRLLRKMFCWICHVHSSLWVVGGGMGAAGMTLSFFSLFVYLWLWLMVAWNCSLIYTVVSLNLGISGLTWGEIHDSINQKGRMATAGTRSWNSACIGKLKHFWNTLFPRKTSWRYH